MLKVKLALIASTLIVQLAAPTVFAVPYTTATWILTEVLVLPSRKKDRY